MQKGQEADESNERSSEGFASRDSGSSLQDVAALDSRASNDFIKSLRSKSESLHQFGSVIFPELDESLHRTVKTADGSVLAMAAGPAGSRAADAAVPAKAAEAVRVPEKFEKDDPVQRDEAGRPIRTSYPDGTSTTFRYDRSGDRPSEITHFDKDGKELSRINQSSSANTEYTVKADGTLESRSYNVTAIKGEPIYDRQGKPIGNRSSEQKELTLIHSLRPDGTQSDKREYPDRSSREIISDKNGNPSQYIYTSPEGKQDVWRREANSDNWFRASDTKREKPWAGTVELKEDGRLIEKDKNGNISEVSKNGQRGLPADQKQWREDLSKLADKTLPDAKTREQFKADLEAIEERVKAGKLLANEAANTYKEIFRVMSTESQVGLSAEQRVSLGRQLLHQTAHPDSVDQGPYDNCNVSAPEVRMYYRNPSAMAKLVADTAITGKYTATNGQTVDISRSIQPANESHLKVPPADTERSFASQLYQLTSINLSLADKFPGQNLEYVQKTATATDVGARLLDKSHTPPKEVYGFADGKPVYEPQAVKDELGRQVLDANLRPVITGPVSNPGLTIQDSVNSMEKITGKKEVGSAIAHFQAGGQADNWILDKVGLANHIPMDKRIPVFENEAQLRNILESAKKEGKFPIVLQVNTGSGFLAKQVEQASGKPLGGEGAGFGGGHVLCIKDYDPATGKVEIDNTWGRSRDKLGKDAVTLTDIMEISKANPKMQAAEKQYNNELQAAYQDWCKYFNKTPGKDYPPASMGKSWLQRYRQEQQKRVQRELEYVPFGSY